MTTQERIQKAIEVAAKEKPGYKITTAAEILPLMDASPYRTQLDLAYGDRDTERLDIFYPDGEGPFPVFVEIHGGGFYFGQKRSIEFEPFLLGLKRGYACVSLNYTLCPDTHYPLPVQEIKGALRFLKKNAEKFRLDPDRIAVWGGSAGAFLAALAVNSCDTGFLEEDLFGNSSISAKPAVLALWYGFYDYFNDRPGRDDWMFQNFYGVDDLSSHQELITCSCPINHITNRSVPTFLQHGTADNTVPYEKSVAYQKVLNAYPGRVCEIELLEGAEHADDRFFAPENVSKVFDFIDRNLPQK